MNHEFEPYQQVLMRDQHSCWIATFFSHIDKGEDRRYVNCNGFHFEHCIEYTGNERLLGTKDWQEPNYKFSFGQKVRVWDNKNDKHNAIYIGENPNTKSDFRYIAIIKGYIATQNWVCCEPFEWEDSDD